MRANHLQPPALDPYVLATEVQRPGTG
jgi:hypothetical protein